MRRPYRGGMRPVRGHTASRWESHLMASTPCCKHWVISKGKIANSLTLWISPPKGQATWWKHGHSTFVSNSGKPSALSTPFFKGKCLEWKQRKQVLEEYFMFTYLWLLFCFVCLFFQEVSGVRRVLLSVSVSSRVKWALACSVYLRMHCVDSPLSHELHKRGDCIPLARLCIPRSQRCTRHVIGLAKYSLSEWMVGWANEVMQCFSKCGSGTACSRSTWRACLKCRFLGSRDFYTHRCLRTAEIIAMQVSANSVQI